MRVPVQSIKFIVSSKLKIHKDSGFAVSKPCDLMLQASGIFNINGGRAAIVQINKIFLCSSMRLDLNSAEKGGNWHTVAMIMEQQSCHLTKLGMLLKMYFTFYHLCYYNYKKQLNSKNPKSDFEKNSKKTCKVKQSYTWFFY